MTNSHYNMNGFHWRTFFLSLRELKNSALKLSEKNNYRVDVDVPAQPIFGPVFAPIFFSDIALNIIV